MHRLGCARALSPEEDRIVSRKGETMERDRSRGCHQDESRLGIAVGQKGSPGSMSANRKIGQVIEGGALDAPVVKKEAAWFDQVDLDSEAGGKPQ